MQRTVCTLLVLLALLGVSPASVVPQQTQDLKRIEEGLKAATVGKVLTLRGFYRGDQLRFNPDGTLIDGGKPGPWTLYGKIQVTNVRVKPQELEIEGNRLFLLYEENQGWKQLSSGQTVRVKIDYAATAELETEIRPSLRRVFLAPGETMADIAPPYWRRFLRKETQGNTQSSAPVASGSDKTSGQEPQAQPNSTEIQRIRVSVGVQQARLLKTVDPQYPQVARRGGVQGEVHLEAVIGKDGKVIRLEIVRPRGMGLDEAVVDAVNQWEYSPVLLGGKPVEVETLIIVRFKMY